MFYCTDPITRVLKNSKANRWIVNTKNTMTSWNTWNSESGVSFPPEGEARKHTPETQDDEKWRMLKRRENKWGTDPMAIKTGHLKCLLFISPMNSRWTKQPPIRSPESDNYQEIHKPLLLLTVNQCDKQLREGTLTIKEYFAYIHPDLHFE